ncbi:3-oxoacyl-ACP reductase [Nocardia sp. NRRL S-836]|uniref:3-oxoacyl-ACP reductase n=1 Tax=Nocardia sp. NRRL S-836 TaxID=1519492 RepID=UPI0006AFB88D|nr:3-oxoacyl-ACP reductase [Nocardia sp. NRRL S-836]
MDLAGKVAVVTGAGAGLGRAEALELARAGASVVLNDLPGAADAVVAEIEELGAKCAVVEGDVGERSTADALVAAAVELGGPHVVVNNAGVLRDRMLVTMSDEDWDLVVRVHLRGHFLLSRNAVALWRQQSKTSGEPVYGRIVNTSSEAFLLGPEGQANYAAAKAGITALTVATARGTGRYGVRANAICPRARTGMTAHVFGDAPPGADPLDPVHVARFVAYLVSPAASEINGQVFVVHGGMVALMAPPTVEQRFDALEDVAGYFAARDPQRTFSCTDTLAL